MRKLSNTAACLLCGVVTLISVTTFAAPKTAQPGASLSNPEMDKQAMSLFHRGMALMEDRQEDRGIKVLEGVPLNFPNSPVRFKAMIQVAKHLTEKGEFALAIKKLLPVLDAEDAEAEHKAEALYRIGICYYGDSDYNRALSTLRQVTESYPWSIHANEAYYYIGLCHFQLKRWRKAVDALKMVGTSVPPNEKSHSLVEAGQRFLVKVQDKDLRVRKALGQDLVVDVKAESGDVEPVTTSVFDDEGEYFLGSIKMQLGAPTPGDGILQVKGGDTIRVEYTDVNTMEGAANVPRLAVSKTVSTAVAGFMDGAYREYVHGVFADQKSFVRVKDLDMDVSDQKDKVQVRIYVEYKVEEDEVEEAESVLTEAGPTYKMRDEITMTLEETGAHSGLFAGKIVIAHGVDPDAAINTKDSTLTAFDHDIATIEYIDNTHIGGLDEPRKATAKAEFLTGQIPDVYIAHREVSTEDLRARKNLIEARFYLRLAEIFRDVGLVDRSADKSDIGLEKVADVLRQSIRASISRELIEDAYRAKWELLLTKGDLRGAIDACRTLMALYPSSSLADVALMQIAKANLETDKIENRREALQILNGVLSLKGASPDLKAEAQYLLGTVMEKEVAARFSDQEQRMKAMGPAIAAYKACADKYPDSPFAGESLSKVIDFHLEARDYARCNELLQMVFVDFPDAPFLDEMLLKWGVVLARMNNYPEAMTKLQMLMRDYPNSSSAGKAKKIAAQLERRL